MGKCMDFGITQIHLQAYIETNTPHFCIQIADRHTDNILKAVFQVYLG